MHRSPRWISVASLLVTALGSAPAIAEHIWLPPSVAAPEAPKVTEAKREESGKHRVAGNIGLSSPVGELGLTYTYAPLPSFQIELGIGIGFTGTQYSLMPKLLIGDRHHHLVLGFGPSAAVNNTELDAALWVNGDIGYEYRSPTGSSFMIAGGFFKGIAGQAHMPCVMWCNSDSKGTSHPATDFFFPQIRIAWGHWF